MGRLVAGLVGLALAAVVVTVLVAVGSEVRAELAPAIAKDNAASETRAPLQLRLLASAVALRLPVAEHSGEAHRSQRAANLRRIAKILRIVTRSSA
jgi:hypothetical protein